MKTVIYPLNYAVNAIKNSLHQAEDSLYRNGGAYSDEERLIAEHSVERAFIGLLILCEHLGLGHALQQIEGLFQEAKGHFLDYKMGPDGPYLIWGEKIRHYVDGIAAAHGLETTSAADITALKEIIKRTLHVICSPNLFPALPASKADIHDRIEAILKCHFDDLKRTPVLLRPPRHFAADSAIPSLKTLIEYQFVDTLPTATRVAEYISAGIHSTCPQWEHLLRIVYETRPFLSEEEWIASLQDGEPGRPYSIIILTGDKSTSPNSMFGRLSATLNKVRR